MNPKQRLLEVLRRISEDDGISDPALQSEALSLINGFNNGHLSLLEWKSTMDPPPQHPDDVRPLDEGVRTSEYVLCRYYEGNRILYHVCCHSEKTDSWYTRLGNPNKLPDDYARLENPL